MDYQSDIHIFDKLKKVHPSASNLIIWSEINFGVCAYETRIACPSHPIHWIPYGESVAPIFQKGISTHDNLISHRPA
jgi:hypothetical protein